MPPPSLASTKSWLLLLCFAVFVVLLYFYRDLRAEIGLLRRSGSEVQPNTEADDTLLIYNRIPKTGSTSLMHLSYELGRTNDFSVVLLNLTRPAPSYVLSTADQRAFAANASAWKDRRPAIFHGHFAFIDFDKMGVTSSGSSGPIYINVIRRPLDRLVSYYYFLRYGDDFRKDKIRSRMGDTVSFDDCVSKQLSDCDPKKMWLQVPWFCGHFKKCWEPGSKWALEQAKRNLVSHYFLVGVTEELDAFIELLERTLPRFFAGAAQAFRQSADAQHIRRTRHKDKLSEATIAHMQQTKVWKLEDEFYRFAYDHFAWVRGDREQTPGVANFHYEKIRPSALRPK